MFFCCCLLIAATLGEKWEFDSIDITDHLLICQFPMIFLDTDPPYFSSRLSGVHDPGNANLVALPLIHDT